MQRAIDADWDEDDLLDDWDEQPLPRARARLPWFRMCVMSGITVSGLVFFARHDATKAPPAPKDVPAAILVAPPPAWRPLPQAAFYGIDKPLLPMAFDVRQHRSGAREDTLLLGQFGEAHHARISI